MSALLAAALHTARPFMRAWAAIKEDELAMMPRPLDQPRSVADGPSADRILLIGSGPAAGWGVTSHDLALPGAIARAVRARTGRGCVVDVIVDVHMTAANLAAVLGGAQLERYDAVVTTVGTNDAVRFTSPAEWRSRIGRAIETWSTRVRRGNVLLMVGIQPIRSISIFTGIAGRLADRLAMSLNAITDELADSATTVRTTVLPTLNTESTVALGRRTPADYEIWARQVAAELTDHLDAAAHAGEGHRTASDRLTAGVEDGDSIAQLLAHELDRLDKIVTLAAAGLKAPTALVTVLGPDTQWNVSRFGTELPSMPIGQSFCAVAMRHDDGMVVPDAVNDPRFAANPCVTSAMVGYYAGVPIEDPSGRRIGALCVFDSKARAVTTEAELSLLRGLAEKVQRVVWVAVERHTMSQTQPPVPHVRGGHTPSPPPRYVPSAFPLPVDC